MLERLTCATNPNLLLLSYAPLSLGVLDLCVVPKHFFAPEIIAQRSPLSSVARRAGWVGCYILLNRIPESGKIYLIKGRHVQSQDKVRALWKKTIFLREERKVEARGWLLDIMRCLDLLNKNEFTLAEIYQFETVLARQHPSNRHIKDKIRQQLQVLRDRKYIQFIGRGEYRLL